jgi:diguanylate cyclase (GGDEF)-like protein/putative nucleotidyltransferase with HDIG domain
MQSWASVPLRLKIYITSIISISIPILVYSIRVIDVTDVTAEYYQWPILTFYALISIPVFVYLPSVSMAITVGDAFVMSICMLWGMPQAVISNTLYMSFLTLLLRRKHNSTGYRVCFNIATAIINTCIYGLVCFALNPTRSATLKDVLPTTFAVGTAYFLSNSLFVAAAVSLSTGTNILKFWRENYSPLWLEFQVSASAAAIIMLFRQFAAPVLAAPFIGILWSINKINRSKADDAARHLKEQEALYLRTVESLALAVDAKDQSTYGHIRRVRAYALGLAKIYGMKDIKELMAIETGSLLHDIGKLAIDDYILNKPGRLSRPEYEKMKMHAAAGDEILQQVRFPFPVAKYVRSHHERWDGNGYPDGLKEEQIPLGARILAVADAYDAIRSTRPYKQSFGTQDSIELLRAQGGTAYDPALVRLFIQNAEELETAADEASRNVAELSFRKYFETIDRALSAGDPSCTAAIMPAAATEDLVTLFEFCSSIGTQLELPDAFSVISRRLERILPLSACVFYLHSDDGWIRAAHASGKHSGSLRGAAIPLGKGVSGWVAAYKKPMMNTRPALDLSESRIQCPSFTDVLSVPLVADAECIGALTVYCEEPVVFSETHQGVLMAAAKQIAPLIFELRKRQNLEKAPVDSATETYRLNYLPVIGAQLIAAAQETQSPLSLLLVEVKNFSQISSLYGSNAGNAVLRRVAESLKAELRETDVVVRYGYQGFAALLPGVRPEQAARCAQRLLKPIREVSTVGGGGYSILIHCQTAVASYQHDGSGVFDLLQTAQRSLPGRSRRSDAQGAEGNILEFFPRS